jgi:hypothetical protein
MKTLSILTLLLCSTFAHAATLFIPLPDQIGNPGDTIFWGYNITSSSDWILITSANFENAPGQFSIGIFTPIIPNNFIVVGPDNNPLTDPVGIGSYAINSFQLPGDSVTGQIVLTYDQFSINPNDAAFNPVTDTIATGLLLRADASVTIPGGSEVPEPRLGLLVAAALCGLMARRKASSPSPLSAPHRECSPRALPERSAPNGHQATH